MPEHWIGKKRQSPHMACVQVEMMKEMLERVLIERVGYHEALSVLVSAFLAGLSPASPSSSRGRLVEAASVLTSVLTSLVKDSAFDSSPLGHS